MFICSCHAVTDGAIKKAVQSGTVKTFRELARATGCGTQCGICAKGAKEVFDKAKLDLAHEQGLGAVAAHHAASSAEQHAGEHIAEVVAQSETANFEAARAALTNSAQAEAIAETGLPGLELAAIKVPCSPGCVCTCDSNKEPGADSVSASESDSMSQARELARGVSEILPGGVEALAARIEQAKAEGRPLRIKLGVDPTSSNLHLGHAVVLRKLKRFQDFGHQVVLLIGGFTAQIGDPTGRSATRPALSAEQVADNARTYLAQVGKVLDLSRAEVVNNSAWFSEMPLSKVLELASGVTVNQLLAKDGFGERIASQQPLSMVELFYPVLQGFDSVALRADIELGGTDQRFNLLQGRQMQPQFGQPAQLAMLLPLLQGTDGVKKMSKSFGNHIGLADEPDDMFGKVMRLPDRLIETFFDLATVLEGGIIDGIKADLANGANPRDAKQKLAHQIVLQSHGEAEADATLEQWRRIHSERQVPLEMPAVVVALPELVTRIMVDNKLAKSGNQARQLIEAGGVRLDGVKLDNVRHQITTVGSDGLVLQVGRRSFVRLLAQAS